MQAKVTNMIEMKKCTAKMSANGRCTIPSHIRKSLEIGAGDTVELYVRAYNHDTEVTA